MSKDKYKQAERRDFWIREIIKYGGYAVNIKHRIQINEDKALKSLIDEGIVIKVREHHCGGKNITILYLKGMQDGSRAKQ